LVKCPWCREEIPLEEYSKHYDECYKGNPPEKEFKRTQEKERRTYTWRGPYHRYVDFQVVTCLLGIPEEARKSLEEDLKDPNSDIRRDIRRIFEPSPPGEYEFSILMPPYKHLGETAGCIIKFRKVR